MKIQKHSIKTGLTSVALLTTFTLVPVLAAPGVPTPSAEIKVSASAPATKPAAIRIIVPSAQPVSTKINKNSAKHTSDYRFSNPSRWNSDCTCNSIRNQ